MSFNQHPSSLAFSNRLFAVPVKSRGFTLVELLVTLAILAILVMIAIPNFKILLNQSRSMSFSNELVSALNLARSEAVKRGTPVSVCAYNTVDQSGNSLIPNDMATYFTGAGSTLPCNAANTDWVNGWLVFTDPTLQGATVAAVTNLLKVGQPSNYGLTMLTTATTPAAPNDPPLSVTYLPSGALSPSAAVTLSTCAGTAGEGVERDIFISITGRFSISKGTC